jgi:glutathione S-transferase
MHAAKPEPPFMILIGQYDSCFVRRVGIALTLYGMPFEHKPWSTFGEIDKIQQYNPLHRVPTLVLDNGDVLIESHLILDYIDSLVPAEQRMFPVTEPERHRALKVAALATGFTDKGVALFYELRLHDHVSPLWVERCKSQMFATLAVLEADRAARKSEYWFGDRIGHVDIVVATAIRHISESHPGLIPMTDYRALAAHCAKLESMPVFQEIQQPFIPPA